jgi:hypothetical protein
MIITVANQATLLAWGRDKSVIGLPFHDALPELHDQPFESLIGHVLATSCRLIISSLPISHCETMITTSKVFYASRLMLPN